MALTREQQRITALIETHSAKMPFFVDEYVQVKIQQQDFSINTMLTYLYVYDDFFKWLCFDIKIVKVSNIKDIQLQDLENLKKNDVQIYFEKHKEENIASEKQKEFNVYEKREVSTLNGTKSALRSLFKYLADESENDEGETYLGRNVMSKFPLTRSRIKSTERSAMINQNTLKGDEITDFLTFVANDYINLLNDSKQKRGSFKRDKLRDIAILTLFLGSGVRVNELASLEIKAINLKTGKISFKRKGGKTDNIPVTIEAVLAIEKYLAVRTTQYPGAEYSPFLFVTKHNGKAKDMAIKTIQNLVNKYTKAFLGNTQLSPHKLRHSFAFDYAKANGDNLQLLSEQLGHSNINTTLLYSNKSDEERAAAVENVSKNRGDY